MPVPATKSVRSPQIRPRLRVALDALVNEGLTIGEAAERSGMAYEAVRVAIHKPHVQAAIASLKRQRLGLESLRSFSQVVKLRDGAQSERVQLDACKVILSAAGDLEPERQHGPSGGAVIQIVINAAHQEAPLVRTSPSGVVESPPFDPAKWRPVIEHAPQPVSDDEDEYDAEG